MQAIPLTPVPAQSFGIVLAGQNCQINLYSLQTPGDILGPVQVPVLDSQGRQIYDSYGHAIYTENFSTLELQGYPALYADVLLNGAAVISCRIVRNLIPWLLDAKYQGFVGDLVMVDTLADTEPTWTGLGTRYQLAYLQASDLS